MKELQKSILRSAEAFIADRGLKRTTETKINDLGKGRFLVTITQNPVDFADFNYKGFIFLIGKKGGIKQSTKTGYRYVKSVLDLKPTF
jgi:hypothetical protein